MLAAFTALNRFCCGCYGCFVCSAPNNCGVDYNDLFCVNNNPPDCGINDFVSVFFYSFSFYFYFCFCCCYYYFLTTFPNNWGVNYCLNNWDVYFCCVNIDPLLFYVDPPNNILPDDGFESNIDPGCLLSVVNLSNILPPLVIGLLVYVGCWLKRENVDFCCCFCYDGLLILLNNDNDNGFVC